VSVVDPNGGGALLVPDGGASLPTATAADELLRSTGAGTTYEAVGQGDVVGDVLVAFIGSDPAGTAIISDGAGDVGLTSAAVSGLLAATTAAEGRAALSVYSTAQVDAAIAAAPSATSGLDAARPAASALGRSYYATDTRALYLDTGSAWVVASNGCVLDGLTLAGFSSTAFLRGTSGPAGGKGTTLALCFYLPTLPGGTQRFLWSCCGGGRGWGLAISGPGVTNNAIDYVLNNSSILFDKQIGSALTTGWHTVAVAVASDGLTLAYSIDGAAATTGVSVASGSYAPAQAADNHTIGGWYGGVTMGDGLEVGACVSIVSVADAAQLQALSADFASGRICTPAALAEDFAFRAPLMPLASTATGAYVRGTGATSRALVTTAPLRVTAR
jgi:hypothetical protein